MVSVKNKKTVKYVYDVPEGGWGYVVALGLSVSFSVTMNLVTTPFGMIYGDFIASMGDEAENTTLVNGILNFCICLVGLITNKLITMYSKRKVGLAGSILFFIGAFSNIFVTNLFQFIISFGVIQGVGFGLMMAAGFSSFNEYFIKRKSVMMAVAQAGMVSASMACPYLVKILRTHYGFRGTVAIIAAISLHGVLAMMLLQPVEWHMIRRRVLSVEMQSMATIENSDKSQKAANDGLSPVIEDEPLMEGGHFSEEKPNTTYNLEKRRISTISVGSMVLGIDNQRQAEDKGTGFWESIAHSMDLKLFKEPVFVNIAFGLSLGFTSDLAFLSMIPLLLTSQGFDISDVTTCLTIFFASDLTSRILISLLSALVKVKNRHLFLGGSILTIVFRIGFTANNDFTWICAMAGVLGFLRAYIQTPLPLVIAEQYPIERFTAAFSLYMVICGVVSLAVGPLIGMVKYLTQSNQLAAHVLTFASCMCAGPWVIEMFFSKICSKK